MKSMKPLLLLAATLFLAAPALTAAGAQEAATWRKGAFPAECAKRDLQLLTQIEQYGESRDMRPELANEAFWTMMEARRACYEGRIAEGLSVYDSIQARTLAQRPH